MISTQNIENKTNGNGAKLLARQITFQYDWDNDTECEISEEILSELPMGKKGESRRVCAIEANMSPFGSKISKEIANASFTHGTKLNLNERKALTVVDDGVNVNESSFIEEAKSTDLESTYAHQHLHKSTNMKDQITGLLKMLVIEKKRRVNNGTSKLLANNNSNGSFVSMKDINCA